MGINRVCEHGRRAFACDSCELIEAEKTIDQLQHKIGELIAECDQLKAQVKHLTADTSDAGTMLNRRVDIENHLAMCAAGKQPLPTAEDCRVLALRLGTPKKYWNDYLKTYVFGSTEIKGVH